jgi:hypothetical protein
MHSYAIFTAKKGRPRIESSMQYSLPFNRDKTTDADVIESLLYLKKISNEQYDAAKFYQLLCNEYYRSIDSPRLSSSSMVRVENSFCRTMKHPDVRDREVATAWIELKSAFGRIDSSCEDIVYKVIIENKLKYELLNPTNVTKNSLRILQRGLDEIEIYRNRRNIRPQ